MIKFFHELKDKYNKNLPLKTAHEWFDINGQELTDALRIGLDLVNFDGQGYDILDYYSDKRKELLIGYNFYAHLQYTVWRAIEGNALHKFNVIKVEPGYNHVTIFELVDKIDEMGIEITFGIPLSTEDFQYGDVAFRHVSAYNEMLSQLRTTMSNMHVQIENERLSHGLAPVNH
ncbi:hypothetical protein LMH73_018480 [Vibrio splendidus]|nr:hypothetical protein [Vibrio splendidus]MCC4880326.1 hypothetical protein [Vibrio splendidus]